MKEILRIKQLRENALTPKYESKLASGFDVRAYDCEIWNNKTKKLEKLVMTKNNDDKLGWVIPSNRTVLFKTGFAMACGESQEIQCRSRSGYSLKSPMRISNGIGTIDEDFRGEIGVIMDNNGQYGDWFVPYGERVAQLVICPVIRTEMVKVKELDETDRGTGGYGSTGTK